MTHQYLLEIGVEEIPARFIDQLSDQLVKNMASFLNEHRLSFETITPYSTPRRLAVIVDELAEKQTDLTEKLRGPSLKIAQDEQGEWTQAAIGFTKGQGASLDDIIIEEVKGEDYIFIEKYTSGQSAQDILTQIPDVIKAFNLPNSMTWHNYHFSFVRPIHWFVSLLDEDVVPFEYAEIQADRVTRGHRFLGEYVEVTSPKTYVDQLKEQAVLADQNERRETIVNQIESLASKHNWNVPITDDLLEEVTNLVEWPYAFFGDFDETYLQVPEEILITAMRDHQRYFYALDHASDELLPYFISVRNGNGDHIENVVKGNQKVIVARLEDALFFYEDDMKQTINEFNHQLENVNEHQSIGTLAEKQRRVEKIIPALIESLYLEDAKRLLDIAGEAARMYKFDLMTAVVGEFAELQGTMGEIYAVEFGVRPEVARAIGTQYLPTTSGGTLPDTAPGALLAFADKLDTVISFFNAGIIPTGSNDPYGLRRQAMGMIEIIQDQKWHLDLEQFIQSLFDQRLYQTDEETLVQTIVEFIKARIEPPLRKAGVSHDIIKAVEAAKLFDVTYLMSAAVQLQAMKTIQPDDYSDMVEALTRVINLGYESSLEGEIDETLLENKAEKQLVEKINQLTLTNDAQDQLIAFQSLGEVVGQYFETTMVNSEDESLKHNRYLTMQTLSDYILNMIDPRELLSKF